jgi:peptide-methionine (S)-S-oxide reductase
LFKFVLKQLNNMAVATFAGGCFWCTETLFSRLDGVVSVVPGYTGGHIKNPAYREVCTGRTGHAECVHIEFDPDKVTFTTLLEVFFDTHDPTTLNRQGNDVGTQYRSEIFYHSNEQKSIALNLIKKLETSAIYSASIVTKVTPFEAFYPAEVEHHDYYNLNKNQPYCAAIITPKVKKLLTKYSSKIKTL